MTQIDLTSYMPRVVETTVRLLRKYPCGTSVMYLSKIEFTGSIPGISSSGFDEEKLVKQSRMWASNARNGLVCSELASARLELYEIATDAYKEAVAASTVGRINTSWLRSRVQRAAIVVSRAIRDWKCLDDRERKGYAAVIALGDLIKQKEK